MEEVDFSLLEATRFVSWQRSEIVLLNLLDVFSRAVCSNSAGNGILCVILKTFDKNIELNLMLSTYSNRATNAVIIVNTKHNQIFKNFGIKVFCNLLKFL